MGGVGHSASKASWVIGCGLLVCDVAVTAISITTMKINSFFITLVVIIRGENTKKRDGTTCRL